jgi:hypothetical protein
MKVGLSDETDGAGANERGRRELSATFSKGIFGVRHYLVIDRWLRHDVQFGR